MRRKIRFARLMRAELFASLILINAASAHAFENLSSTIWDYDHGFGCITTITFLSDERYMLESAGQVVMKSFTLAPHRDTEFFLFVQNTIANNNESSCAGIKAGRTGSRQRAYLKFSEDGSSLTLFPKPDDQSAVRVTYTKRATSLDNNVEPLIDQ